MSDILSRIVSGTVERPVSVLVHGGPGVGKSTFAAGAPDPLFIDTDNRTAHLNVKRFKPDNWEEILDVFRAVAKGDVKCGTLVVDTIDHAEILLHRDLCKAHNATSIEDVGGGYGKGYVVALGEWRRFGVAMDAIRSRGVHLVLLAHNQVKAFQNVGGEDYQRIEVKLDKRAHNFLRERVDGVGYAAFDTQVIKTKEGKAKAKTTGRATLSFAPSAAVETKRFEKFPVSCDLTWEAFTKGDK